MNGQGDNDLRAHFDAQRRTDSTEAPSFTAVMERARAAAPHAPPMHRPKGRRLMYFGGLSAAAAIAALLMIPGMRSNDDAFEQAVLDFQSDPASGAWRSPTDALLNVPGSRMISTVPSIGTQ